MNVVRAFATVIASSVPFDVPSLEIDGADAELEAFLSADGFPVRPASGARNAYVAANLSPFDEGIAIEAIGAISATRPDTIAALVRTNVVGTSSFASAISGMFLVHREILLDTGLEVVFLRSSRRESRIEGSFSFYTEGSDATGLFGR